MPRKPKQYGRVATKKRKRRRHGKQKRAARVREMERHQANPLFQRQEV